MYSVSSYCKAHADSFLAQNVTIVKLLAVVIIAGVLLLIYQPVDSKSLNNLSKTTVMAAGRGKPYFNLRDGREMQVEYRGDQALKDALRSDAAQPRSLASADLDNNGTPDVVAGYSYNGIGIVTVQRGNPDAFAPKDESVFPRLQQGYNPDPLLPEVEIYQVPVSADFVQVGNFNQDNNKDVLVAAKGGELFLLAGDGEGGLRTPQQIGLPGLVTALTAGQFKAADGYTDVAVTVSGSGGAALLLYDGAEGGIAGEPVRYQLPAEASAVEFGELDSDPFMDVAVAAAGQILIVHGWGRKLKVDPQSRVERIDLPFTAMGLAPGFFIWNREAKKQLAAIGEDGTVRILQRGEAHSEPFSEGEIAQRARARIKQTRTDPDVETVIGWQPGKSETWTTAREVVTGNVVQTNALAQSLLTRAHVSFFPTDDLFLPISSERKLKILHQVDSYHQSAAESLTAGDITAANLDLTSAPVATVTLPQKLNGERSIVLLQSQSALPTIIPQAPTAVITVDRTDDVAGAFACTAVANDCSLRGAVTFANLAINSGSTINIPAGTYVLSINGAGGCINENTLTGNTIGDLESNNPTTFTGAGSATTIIRQIGVGGGGFTGDRVICLNVPITIGALTWSFSGVTITGGRESSGIGGAGLVGGAKDNVLNMTNVVVSNNRDTAAANYSGGGVSITGGSLNITNCTIGGTSPPGADRTDVNLANSAGTSGGGVGYSPGHPIPGNPGTGTMVMAGTTLQNNTAASIAAGGGGADLYTHNQGTGSVSITTSTFANNQAIGAANSGSGGGIIVESIPTTVATTAFNTNSATNRGGGIYVAGGSLALDGTTPSINFSGNTATNAGSSVSTASATTVSGTNTTIGGDIEISTNGSWTNNTGSALAPTNVLITGGTFTCNNSTVNIGGNLTLQPGPVVGGAFNANSAAVNIAGNFTLTAGGAPLTSFSGGTSTFTFNGAGAQSISGSLSPTFNNLIVNKTSGTLTLGVNTPIAGNLSLLAGTFDLATFTANRTAAGGTLTVSNGTLLKIGGTNTLPSNFSTHSIGATSTIEYSGTNQSVATLNSAQNYGNLTISGSGTKTLLGAITIVNNVTLTAGTLDVSAGNFGMNVGGNWTNNGGAFATRAGSTVTFNGAGAQAINGTAASQSFNGVTVNKGNTLSVGGSTTTLTVGGPLTLTTGNFDAGTATTINVSGNWTQATGTTFTPGASTVVFNGAGAQSIDGTLATKIYNNFTVSKTGGSTLSGAAGTTALDINGNFNLSTGNFTAGTAVNITAAGNWTQAAGTTFTPGAGTVDFDGGGAQGLNGTAATQTFNNFTHSGGGTLTGGGSLTTLNINGTVLLSNGSFSAGTATAINVGGDWTNNSGATFTPGSSTVTFNNTTAAQAINGTIGSQTFNGITVAKTAQTLSVGGTTGTLTLNGNMTLTSGTFDVGTATFINVGGNWTNNGGNFTPGASTVTFIGGGAQNLNGTAATQTFNNFGVNKSGGSLTGAGSTTTLTLTGNMSIVTGTFAAGTITTINVPGDWANSGTFTGGSSTVSLIGNNNSQTLLGNTTFNNLTINHTGTGGVSGAGSTLAVTGLLRVQSGTFTSNSTFNNVQIDAGTTLTGTNGTTMNVTGNWTNNGTFTPNNNVVNFNGANNTQTISGSATSFDNLMISHTGTGGVSLSADVTVNTLLTFTSGTIATNANSVIVGAAASINRTSGHVIGALKKIAVPASFTFHVGTASGYTPLTLANVSGGGDLSVRTNTPQEPALGAANSLHEYWTLIQTGSLTGDMTYAYLLGDVFGNEALYRIIRVTGGTVATFNNAVGCPPAGSPCVNPATHTATINGVSAFGVEPTFTSDWTVGETVPTAATGTVTGRITTAAGAAVAGAVVNLSGAQTRKTITDANGNYQFDGVATNGFYTVTPSRANFSFSPANRSFSQLSERTEAAFTANAGTEAANPLDTTEYFVRQQYVDLLGREPDEGGFNYWSDQILGCGSDAGCQTARRREVAAAFFIEAEFQRTGSFVYGLYKGALGRQPVYQEFSSDRQQVVDGPNLEALKQAFAESFASRPEFVTRYQNNTTAESFVDALVANIRQGSGIDLGGERATFITQYNAGGSLTQSRSLALRAMTESATFRQAEYNAAFVLTEYFGYLRRDPDAGGYAFWLDVLNNRAVGDYRSMVCAFTTSTEYQQRFSTIVSRSNSQCGQ